jgi:hypothetical protein
LTSGTAESAASSASLTLAPDGSSVVATFQSEGQSTATFDLRATSHSSATLTASGQGFAGEWGWCGGGVEEFDSGETEFTDGEVIIQVGAASPAPTQATLSMSSAELTVDQGVAFVQINGAVVDVQGQPGCAPDGPPTGPTSALLVCDASSTGDGGTAAGDAGALTFATSAFLTGSYDCSSSAYTVVTYDGMQDNIVSSGGAGTLTLNATGSSLSATYSLGTLTSGTLDFTTTSDSSANPVPGQTIEVACGGIDPTTMMSPNVQTVTQVSAGALTTDGTTLYLTFLGSVPNGTCSGQTSSIVLQCTPNDQ